MIASFTRVGLGITSGARKPWYADLYTILVLGYLGIAFLMVTVQFIASVFQRLCMMRSAFRKLATMQRLRRTVTYLFATRLAQEQQMIESKVCD